MTNEKQNGTIGNTLKKLREEKKLSMATVASALGVSTGAYQKYENNSRDVSTLLLSTLADFYGVTTDYLLGREPEPDPLKMFNISAQAVDSDKFIEEYEKLPELAKQIFIDTMLKLSEAATKREKEDRLISIRFFERTAVSAGTGLYDDNNEYPTVKRVPDNAITRATDFCCYVSGDSMEPDYYDGDLICVKVQPSVEVGEVGVFVINGELFVKKLGANGLVSLNPKYSTIKKSPDIICQGKVLGKID